LTDAELDQCRHDGALLFSVVSRKVQLKREGKDWKGCCPFHSEKTPSFTVFADGHFHCFGCNAHGSVFDFVMQTERLDFPAAVERVAAERGTPSPAPRRPTKGAHHDDTWLPIMPPPTDAPKPAEQQLHCDMLHEYCGADDRTLCYVRRFEAKNGTRKQFFPLTYGVLNGKRGWHARAPIQPRPLYRLNALSHATPDAAVLLCEGEKAADAAQRLFPHMVGMSWMGGASADGGVDLAPLQRRAVILWPDADQPGRDVMARIAKRLTPIRIIDTRGLPDGYDAADLEHGGCDDPDAWLAARLREPEPQPDDHVLPQVVWRDVRLSDWADRDVPGRLWIVPDWIPREQVTGLYGIGGINKTDFLIQLLMASSVGLPFLGYPLTAVGPVYGLFCEDTEAEIVRRASRIADHYGRSLADFPNFHFASLVGFDDPEFLAFDGPKTTIGTALLRFDRTIMQLGAKLATLDTAPDFFGGTEISRRDVTRFVRRLDAVSITRSCAIMYTAHPSVRGRASGALDSGSTGWEAKVRARLSLHDPGNEDDKDADSKVRAPRPPTDRRILTRQKANYASPGETIELICRNGVFTTAALDPEQAARRARGPGRKAECDERFLELIQKAEAAIRYVHDASNIPSHYAPAVFAARQDSGGFSKAEFTRAMRRLLEAGRIRSVPFGPPSRGRSKLEIVQQS
jgi:RecA-family ATPase